MPIYEYKCDKCGAVFETQRKISGHEEKVTCPYCGEKECYQVYSFSTGSNSQTGGGCSTYLPT